MSDVQYAIEELITEQVDSRIDDAISDNHEMNSIRDDISELQAKFEGDLVDEVASKVLDIIIATCKSISNAKTLVEQVAEFVKLLIHKCLIEYTGPKILDGGLIRAMLLIKSFSSPEFEHKVNNNLPVFLKTYGDHY